MNDDLQEPAKEMLRLTAQSWKTVVPAEHPRQNMRDRSDACTARADVRVVSRMMETESSRIFGCRADQHIHALLRSG